MDYSKLLRIFSDKLTEANEIYINEKLSQLGFDKTRRGKVISVSGVNCVVEINGEEFNCKLRRGIYVEPNDIVFVKFPQDNSVDKYVDAILGGNETPENLVISAQEILDKLKTIDGAGSGLDADLLDGKHASEFATLDDLGDIDIDISGEAIVTNINASQSVIDDKNLSENVNDAIDKKHSHTNKSTIDSIKQDDIDTWDTVTNKSDKIYVDNKLGDKVDKVEGKGLSEENYSTSEKSKLAGISNNANKVESSLINGNIKIDNVEKNVYTHPSGTNPHGTTKSDIGLSNVENKSSATIRSEITSANITGSLGYTPENSLNKGVANGYAPLDSNIKIPLSMLPDIAKQQTYVVETIAGRDNLSSLIMGEKCYVTNTGDSYIWDGDSWEILAKADWENVNLQWTNIVGKPNSNVSDIDDATSKRHTHSNKSIIDTVTQTLIDRWNSAWTHISDTIKHITSAERTKWNTVTNKADKNYVDTELGNKVDNSRVLTDVPLNAKFTDTNTTYSEITTAEIDAGTSSTSRVISGRRVQYILDKVGTMISTAIGALNKSSVGLSNVDNTSDLSKPISIATQTALDGKVNNSQVLTNVPSGAKFTDTIYNHPSSHPASMITESTSRRFVSDVEKATWNNKAEISDIPTKVSELTNDSNYVTQGELGDAGFGDMVKAIYDTNNNGIVDNAEKVNGFTVDINVPANAKFTDTIYTHPSSHPASMITESTTKRFVSDTEKSTWNNKANVSDIPDKFIYVGTTSPVNNQMGWIDTSL